MIKPKKISYLLRLNACKNIFGLLAVFFLVSSCVTQRNVEYLQDNNRTSKSFNEVPGQDYKLKPDDELYIQITSQDEAAANIFSNPNNSQNSMQPYGASLASYVINKEGFLLLPLIGSVYVKDKTTPQVSQMIKDSLSNILNQPIVTVKLVNRYISVLGEVRSPGHFPYSQEKLSIFDALSLAGDITEYGNRNQVILTRNENGMNFRINLNLNQSDILSSKYYYIRPNDIVYVKPLRKKIYGMKEFPFSLFISSITTGLLIYSIFK